MPCDDIAALPKKRRYLMMKIRTYTELSSFKTFEERFEYLKLDGIVGAETFGFDRWLNQNFYHSKEWKTLRRDIIVRDNGCDLGIDGYDISGDIIIHHMNPITIDDIINVTAYLMNPDYLICTSLNTHNAIHYSYKELKGIPIYPVERKPFDTCPWKK